ncbi:hypothetical protein OJF2_08830 [Aquisphaera giovannonii]|uniref:Amine oxidase domain-containing protein n=1 Tax=Aquisphaera giovannonii TaxID=406548 RepID=A0A5B9VVP1_9BACT|nr:FAD-dependent oxidoreductase [Aquisphaera giovannonii]QEH32413.1 hypothetical protein OJF2_08830 [Aquisphaera giovannonii]
MTASTWTSNPPGPPPPARPSAPHKIVGLGLGGLGCALALHEKGIPFEAIEKEARPGGLARSERIDGFRFDHGPHVLLGIPDELAPLFDRLDLDLMSCSCGSAIALEEPRLMVPAPFQRHLSHLPWRRRWSIVSELVRARLSRRPPSKSYRDFAIASNGRTIFELFLGRYESKRLRFDLADMPPDWTRRLVPPRLLSVLQGPPRPAAPSTPCGDGSFLYPRSGIEQLPRALGRLLPPGCCRYNLELVAIDLRARRIAFRDGSHDHFDSLTLSLPLPAIVQLIKDPPAEVRDAAAELSYASIYVVSLGVRGRAACPGCIIRYPDPRVDFYRITSPTAYIPGGAPDGCTSLMVELSHHHSRYPVGPDEALHRCLSGLERLGVLGPETSLVTHHTRPIPYAHIVSTHRSPAAIRFLRSFLAGHSIHLCGKYGYWEDMLMPQAILSGMRAAEAIARPRAR